MQHIRLLTKSNIDEVISTYNLEIYDIGTTIQNKFGIPLLISIKRDKLNHGRYPGVTLFEAANRIMSDLVILHGVAGLLKNSTFPFEEYLVELGNEDNNGFDIIAQNQNATLSGEAFNVASSFFQGKKRTAQKKLMEKARAATYKLIMFNSDAQPPQYTPKWNGIYQVAVDIHSGGIAITPSI